MAHRMTLVSCPTLLVNTFCFVKTVIPRKTVKIYANHGRQKEEEKKRRKKKGKKEGLLNIKKRAFLKQDKEETEESMKGTESRD